MPDAVFGNRKVFCRGKASLGNTYCQALITLITLLVPPNLLLIAGYTLSYTVSLIIFYSLNSYKPLPYFWVFPLSIGLLEMICFGLYVQLLTSDPGIVVKPLEDLDNYDTSVLLYRRIN